MARFCNEKKKKRNVDKTVYTIGVLTLKVLDVAALVQGPSLDERGAALFEADTDLAADGECEQGHDDGGDGVRERNKLWCKDLVPTEEHDKVAEEDTGGDECDGCSDDGEEAVAWIHVDHTSVHV